MIPHDYYARPSSNKQDLSTWNLLCDHLSNVGQLAEEFAPIEAMKEISRHTGQWHDLGKYRDLFQKYLKGEVGQSKETQHAIYGAFLAIQYGQYPSALAIAGHHAGLHNVSALKQALHDENIKEELSLLKDRFQSDMQTLPEHAEHLDDPSEAITQGNRLALEFYIRMLFSCLTDADVLDAIRFNEGNPTLPTPHTLKHTAMIELFNHHMNSFSSSSPTSSSSPLQILRSQVHEDCRLAAHQPQGFFQLTVPTGGGKTLSAMRFALEHAATHQLNRVIVVIPYLSIIEQNAQIYQDIFDPDRRGIVIEHHCAVREKVDDQEGELGSSTKSAENWDAPIVVTTTVQLVESLFSNKPGRCRKLHNLARSVILLDEVQTLPHHLLDPLINVLRELTDRYHTSIVLCTATQPAYRKSSSLPHGFTENEVADIISEPQKLFDQLIRVEVFFEEQKQSWSDLSSQWLQHHPKALGIVNTKAQARDWYRKLAEQSQSLQRATPAPSLFHLSSAMCPEHRSDVLSQIAKQKDLSSPDQKCYLIATQVVEAGVDIDFPVVYRALAPLDSLIQAGGRCNREGQLTDDLGKLMIFTPENHSLPPGAYTLATSLTGNLIRSWQKQGKDLTTIISDPQAFEEYFQKLFPYIASGSEDKVSLQNLRKDLRFRDVAQQSYVIAKGTSPVIVPYGKVQDILNEIKKDHSRKKSFISKKNLRKLRRYMVNLRDKELSDLRRRGLLEEVLPQQPWELLHRDAYHSELGFSIP